MLPVVHLFEQLLIVAILSLLAQFRYLEYRSELIKQSRLPIQEKYRTYRQRVLAVDERLFQLNQSNEPTWAQNDLPFSSQPLKQTPNRTMITVNLLVLATQLSINVKKPCGGNHGQSTTLVVIVFNRVEDYFRRKAIRQTFGASLKRNTHAELYFLVGKHHIQGVQERLLQEAELFNDIIQGDFLENYYNCTIKAVVMVRWVAMNCPFAKFALKLDDDSYVRVNPLLAELDRLEPDMIMGNLNSLDEVIRQNDSKWFISQVNYPKLFYPSHITGIYLIPGYITVILYETIVSEPIHQTIPALPFEDVYITGIVAAKARILRVYFESQLLLMKEIKKDIKRMSKYSILYNTLCPIEIAQLWKIFGEN